MSLQDRVAAAHIVETKKIIAEIEQELVNIRSIYRKANPIKRVPPVDVSQTEREVLAKLERGLNAFIDRYGKQPQEYRDGIPAALARLAEAISDLYFYKSESPAITPDDARYYLHMAATRMYNVRSFSPEHFTIRQRLGWLNINERLWNGYQDRRALTELVSLLVDVSEIASFVDRVEMLWFHWLSINAGFQSIYDRATIRRMVTELYPQLSEEHQRNLSALRTMIIDAPELIVISDDESSEAPEEPARDSPEEPASDTQQLTQVVDESIENILDVLHSMDSMELPLYPVTEEWVDAQMSLRDKIRLIAPQLAQKMTETLDNLHEWIAYLLDQKSSVNRALSDIHMLRGWHTVEDKTQAYARFFTNLSHLLWVLPLTETTAWEQEQYLNALRDGYELTQNTAYLTLIETTANIVHDEQQRMPINHYVSEARKRKRDEPAERALARLSDRGFFSGSDDAPSHQHNAKLSRNH